VAMKVMARARGRGRTPPRRRGRPVSRPPRFKWVIKNSAIATTVPSMTDMEQLEQNFSVMAQQFTDADQKILTARWQRLVRTSADVRPVRRAVPQGPAGGRHGALRHVRGRLRSIPAGSGALSCACRPSTSRTLRPMSDLRCPMPHGVTVPERMIGRRTVRIIAGSSRTPFAECRQRQLE